MSSYNWKIISISNNQMLDVRKEDLLNNGDFRNSRAMFFSVIARI